MGSVKQEYRGCFILMVSLPNANAYTFAIDAVAGVTDFCNITLLDICK